MNKQELEHKLKELQKECDLKQKEVMKQFCDANNPYKVGAMYRLGLRSTELSNYYKLKYENEC